MSKSLPGSITLVLGEKLVSDLTEIAGQQQRSISFVARAFLERDVAKKRKKLAKP